MTLQTLFRPLNANIFAIASLDNITFPKPVTSASYWVILVPALVANSILFISFILLLTMFFFLKASFLIYYIIRSIHHHVHLHSFQFLVECENIVVHSIHFLLQYCHSWHLKFSHQHHLILTHYHYKNCPPRQLYVGV